MKQRILFVDDEPLVLQGLQRTLRPARHEWDMAFVGSGPEALKVLAEQPFDVIVTDMRMPGMSGAELLETVKLRHPRMIRIVLSGQSEEERMMRVIGPAHQLVSKPCEPDALRLTLRRACAIGTILSEGTLKAILSQVGTVPSPPALYLAIVKELKSEEPSVRRVGDIVATDPGMTAKILQLVNSAFFGFRKHVSEPHHAVSLLGLDTVTSLVLSVKIFAEYDPAQIRALGLSGLLRHSVRVGAYARIVASEGGLHSDAVDDAFAAGLLHDVGRLVLGTWLGEKSGIVAARIQHEALPFWEIERQVFNATHAQVGAYMMGLWGLPDELVEAVAFHHNPTESPNVSAKLNPLGAVYLADAFSFENDDAWPGLAPTLSEPYLASIGVTFEQVERWQKLCLAAVRESDVLADVSG